MTDKIWCRKTTTGEQLVCVDEAARVTGISKRSLINRVRRGELSGYSMDGAGWLTLEAVRNLIWLESEAGQSYTMSVHKWAKDGMRDKLKGVPFAPQSKPGQWKVGRSPGSYR